MRLGVTLILVGVSNFAYFICMQVHVIGHIHLFCALQKNISSNDNFEIHCI